MANAGQRKQLGHWTEKPSDCPWALAGLSAQRESGTGPRFGSRFAGNRGPGRRGPAPTHIGESAEWSVQLPLFFKLRSLQMRRLARLGCGGQWLVWESPHDFGALKDHGKPTRLKLRSYHSLDAPAIRWLWPHLRRVAEQRAPPTRACTLSIANMGSCSP
jgi:hypothetical protein